jgi:8-oxo-dGTP pyrophosphatase MutT (NUDIX family)
MPNVTTDSVRIVLFDAQDKDYFLTLSETDDPDNFKLPGGKFDTEVETPEECARREIQEEISLSGVDMKFCGELVNEDGSSRRFIFSSQISRDQAQPTREIAKFVWVAEPPAGKNFGHMSSALRCAKEAA